MTSNVDPSQAAFHGASVPTPALPDDDGATSPQLRFALDELSAGRGGGIAVLQALAESRLLVPVVAVLDEGAVDVDGNALHEKESSMAAVFVDSGEHGRALLAFSGADPLQRWRADARPVPMSAPLAARAAVAESASALVVDVSGPTPFAVAGYELLLLGSLSRPTQHVASDPVLRAAVARVVGDDSFELEGGDDGQPVQLTVRTPVDGVSRQTLVEALANDRVVSQLVPQGLRVGFRDTP